MQTIMAHFWCAKNTFSFHLGKWSPESKEMPPKATNFRRSQSEKKLSSSPPPRLVFASGEVSPVSDWNGGLSSTGTTSPTIKFVWYNYHNVVRLVVRKWKKIPFVWWQCDGTVTELWWQNANQSCCHVNPHIRRGEMRWARV